LLCSITFHSIEGIDLFNYTYIAYILYLYIGKYIYHKFRSAVSQFDDLGYLS
jgi:hypothetical protein